jgi:hypothetical protein
VRQKALDRDCALAFSVLQGEPRQMLRDWIIESQSAGVTLLHHGHAGEQLRDRADAVDRVGGGGPSACEVSLSEPAAPEHLLIDDDGRRHAGDLIVGPAALQARVRASSSAETTRTSFATDGVSGLSADTGAMTRNAQTSRCVTRMGSSRLRPTFIGRLVLPLTERGVEDIRVMFALAQEVLEDVVDVDVGVVYLQRIEGGLRRGRVLVAQCTECVGQTLHVLTWTCVRSRDGGHQFPDQALVVPLVRGEDIGVGGQLIGPGPGC